MGLQGSEVRILSPRPSIKKPPLGGFFIDPVQSEGSNRRRRFDKIVGNNFERRRRPRRGGGQDARSNPLAPTIYKKAAFGRFFCCPNFV